MDAVVVAVAWLLLGAYLFDALVATFEVLSPHTNPVLGATLVLWAAISLFYYTLFDAAGATVGKAVFGLRLRMERTGRAPGPGAALQRALAGTLDLLFLTTFILPLLNPSGRTIGDYVSGTVVLRRAPAGRRDVPEWGGGFTEADRHRFAVGREAEERAQSSLRELEAHGYSAFTNVVHPSVGDIDVLAVGPGGIFCVEVKAHSGVVTQEPFSGTLLRNGAPFEPDFRKQVSQQAAFLTGYLFKGKSNPPVFSVICFVRASVAANPRGEYPRGMMTLAELCPAILAAQPRLSPRRVEKLSAQAAKLKGLPPGHGRRRGAA